MLMFVVLKDDCNAAAGKRIRKYCPCLVTVLLFFAAAGDAFTAVALYPN